MSEGITKTEFLNVDLDVRGEIDMQPLIAAFGVAITVLHHEPLKFVGFELADICPATPEATIR